MFRYRSSKKQYVETLQDGCPFCLPSDGALVRELPNTLLIKNIFPYDLWEFRDVVEHLLITPKRHVKSLSELAEHEIKEITDLLKEFEAQDYNIYARSIESIKKSVPAHQHTHLIKTTKRKPRFAVFIEKPYWLFKR